jgi:hypothetical protein
MYSGCRRWILYKKYTAGLLDSEKNHQKRGQNRNGEPAACRVKAKGVRSPAGSIRTGRAERSIGLVQLITQAFVLGSTKWMWDSLLKLDGAGLKALAMIAAFSSTTIG